MSTGLQRAVPLTLGVVTLAGVGVLLLWDIVPKHFPAGSHDFLAAFPLAMIACVWLVHEATRRPAGWELVKAVLLASAFLFWAANQLWPTLRQATLFNDLAIALFVFDVILAILGGRARIP
jgi:hypothetical protein